MSLTHTTPSPPRPPAVATGERGVLLVAAGAAFLALLDTTVANLAVADVRTDFAGTSVGGATWLITIYAVVFAALLAPAGRRRRRRRPAVAAARRRGRLHALLARLRARSLAPTLLLRARAPGRGRRGDDPRFARGRARGRAARAPRRAIGPLERRRRARGGGGPGDRRRARRHRRLARPVPRSTSRWGWPSSPARASSLVRAAAAAPPRCRRHARRWAPASARRRSRSPRARTGAGATSARSARWPRRPPPSRLRCGARPATHARDRDRLWRSRTFAAANLASLLYGAALFPWMLVGVLFPVGVWGYSPLEAGLSMTPGAIIAAAVALRAGPSSPAAAPGR